MPRRVIVAAAVVALTAAGCSSSSRTGAGSSPVSTTVPAATTRVPAPGPVEVLYAGSLVTLMEHRVGAGFQAATGITFTGISGDSGSLATEIKGRTQQGDVFISANPSKDQVLEGPANGDWVSWYATFATSELVLGYNPHSRFAAQLHDKPWYDVITEPGFLLGRTDPGTDPKGKLTTTALEDAAAKGAATGPLARSSSNVFPENTLVGRLQSGQLDAGFFYAVEAAAAGIPTVPLAGIETLQARYTITVLNHAPHEAAAAAFVGYLLGPDGSAQLAREGLVVPRHLDVSGAPPADLQAVLSGR